MALAALLVACAALGLAIRTYISYERLNREFRDYKKGYDPNPVYGGRR